MYCIKIFCRWHKIAWGISRRINWKGSWLSIVYYFGIIDTTLIFLGLKNLKLSEISLLERIVGRELIRIYSKREKFE